MTEDSSVPSDPQALAEASASALWSRDRATQGLGMAIEQIGPGHAVMTMPVVMALRCLR